MTTVFSDALWISEVLDQLEWRDLARMMARILKALGFKDLAVASTLEIGKPFWSEARRFSFEQTA